MLERASMQPAAGTIPGARSACRACGKPLLPGKSVCLACGAAHGEENRCPHCSVIADVEPNPALGFRCRVCGGPRIPMDVPLATPSELTKRALILARREHTKHTALTAAGLLLGGLGALGVLVAALVVLAASPGALPTLLAFVAAGVPLLGAFVSLQRAATARTERAAAVHAAQLGALTDVQAVTGALDSARVAEILRIDPERAELLLAEASVAALLQPMPEPRLRVEIPQATLLDDEASETTLDTEKQRGRTEIE